MTMPSEEEPQHCTENDEISKLGTHTIPGHGINRLKSLSTEIQDEKKEVASFPTPSTPSSIHEHVDQGEGDLEAVTTAQSNSPPYSVFSKRKKLFIIFFAAWGGFFSPLSANIYFPALTTLSRHYNVSSTLMNLTLTSYMIFQGLAPTIFGDLADMA
jgi:hypothetical protein